MTLAETLAALLRRWYVPAAVLLIAAVAFLGWHRTGGTWEATPVVTFLRPGAHVLTPDNGLKDDSIIAFASATAQEVNEGHPPERFAADDAPLYGAGLRTGVRVSVPSVGGQWTTSLSDAEIVIQIVGTDRAWVTQTQTTLLAKVDRISEAAQLRSGTAPSDRITTSVMPLSTQISRVQSGTKTTALALLALGLAGLLVGGWLAIRLDVLLRRRASADGPTAAARPPEPTAAGTALPVLHPNGRLV